jgi:hypothetical protein
MKIGDLVRCITSDARNTHRLNELGVIVDVVTHTATYATWGCKKYIVATTRGNEYRCWQGEIEVISESR